MIVQKVNKKFKIPKEKLNDQEPTTNRLHIRHSSIKIINSYPKHHRFSL